MASQAERNGNAYNGKDKMKTQDKQILSILDAFDRTAVLKAINLYQDGIENEFSEAEKQLSGDGWHVVSKAPEGVEFYKFNNKFWVQSDEIRQKNIQEQVAKLKAGNKKKTKPKTDVALKASQLACPLCQAKMYQQNICSGCKEGKQGKKIRLICEECGHEILL